MKILIICDLFPPDVKGGYELRCEEACQWLVKSGYQVEVLSTKNEAICENHVFPVNRLLVQYPFGATPSHWSFAQKLILAIKDNLTFRNVLRQVKPDVIFIWNCTGLSRSLIPNIFNSEIRKVVDVSSTWLFKVSSQHGPIYRFIETNHQKYLHNILKRILQILLPILSLNTIHKKYVLGFYNTEGYFTSRWNKEFHSKHIGLCEEFKVFYTGINLEEFSYCNKKMDISIFKLLYVGRVSEDKGFMLLLDQLDYLHSNSVREFVLTVIGDFYNDYEKKNIQSTVAKLGLEGMVIFKGQLERIELFKYYHQADFTVFPSICDEAFSRVPLESMACGTPCISTDNPGSKELFDLNAPLILLERTSESLTNILDKFACNRSQYEKLSVDGRKFIEESFTFDHFMRNVEKAFLTDLEI